ncbi:MAG: large-conductance mechanosensitive channel protein MscL [Bacteriovoracaceae bacterium]|nr:large-conductance mechanosensitive channel protein MscL [Bacteriovoracaceae bacterium]
MVKNFVEEFKSFALKGNVLDMAVGVIIGGSFGKIVSSLVNDVIMPPIGLLIGGVNFNNLYLNLSGTDYENLEAATKAGVPILKYGSFIQTVVDFTILALCVFVMVKILSSIKRKEEAAPAAPAGPTDEIKLLTEIRDALKK